MVTTSIDELAARLEEGTAEDVLRWAVVAFSGEVALASSFGAEDVVLIDLLARVTEHPRVFAIDTGRLPEATYEVADRLRERYGIEFEVYLPRSETIEQLARAHGFHSFRESLEARHDCCYVRKVEPLNRALSGLQAWITGLRREQSVTRTGVPVIEEDVAHGGLLKLNPLAAWTNEEVWAYIREHDVPYNRLHDEGYPSLGCAPCTRAIQAGEHPRAGRWWWELPEQKECGLHVPTAAAPLAS